MAACTYGLLPAERCCSQLLTSCIHGVYTLLRALLDFQVSEVLFMLHTTTHHAGNTRDTHTPSSYCAHATPAFVLVKGSLAILGGK